MVTCHVGHCYFNDNLFFSKPGSSVFDTFSTVVTIEPTITVSDSSTISRYVFAATVKTTSMVRQLSSSATPLKLWFLTTSSFSEHDSSVFDTSSTLVTKTSTLMKVIIVSDSFAISRSASVATLKASSMARQLNNPASKEPKLFLLYVTLGPLLGFSVCIVFVRKLSAI